MGQNWFEKNPIKSLTVFSLIVLVVLLTGLEVFLKWKNKDRLHYRNGTERAIRLREYPPFMIQDIYPDQVFLDMHSQNRFQEKYLVQVDADGFIKPSRTHTQPDTSIVFLGGSTTECLFNRETYRFPYLAGRFIEEQTGLKINSFNGGRGGNNSLHSINILLNKVVPMTPDVVILMHNMNDFVILLLERSYWNKNPKRSQLIKLKPDSGLGDVLNRMLEKLLPETLFAYRRWNTERGTVRGVRKEFKHLHGRHVKVDFEWLQNEFRTNLVTFVAICRLHNIQPVLMTQASRLTDEPDEFVKQWTMNFKRNYGLAYSQFKQLFDGFNQMIRDVGKAKDVLVIDLERNIPKTSDHIFDLIHYTETGSRRAAEVIGRELLKSGYLASDRMDS